MNSNEAKDRLRLAVAEYNAASQQFLDETNEERKTELAWKCFRLHRNYREAFTGLFKTFLAEAVESCHPSHPKTKTVS